MLHIVLYEPEIPQNTGNIMRTCAGTGAKLHLIEPLGFSLDEKHLRRAAMDYLEHVNYEVYKDYEDFLSKNNPDKIYYLSRHGQKRHTDVDYGTPDEEVYMMFGKESAGIPKELLQQDIERCVRIPMNGNVRSFNLSNCAAIVLYEALRQQDFPALSITEPEHFKGKDWLLEK